MTENCNHKWEPISSDMNAEEWVSGLGDNPMICRECGVVRRGDILQEIEELEAKLENLNGMGTVGYMLGYKKGGDGNKVLIDYIKRLEAAFLEAMAAKLYYERSSQRAYGTSTWESYPEDPCHCKPKDEFRKKSREALEKIRSG